MSPRRVAESTFVFSLITGMAVLAAVYLIRLPRHVFETNDIWAGVFRATPFGDPRLIGTVFALGAVFLICGKVARGPYLLLGIGHVLATAAWGLLSGSFIAAASQNNWLGLLTAGAAVAFCLAHLGHLYYRR